MIKFIFVCFACLFIFTNNSYAQGNFGGGIDNEYYNFGFVFQYISSEYKIIKRDNWREPYLDPENNNQPIVGSLNSIRSIPNPGFGIGFVANASLQKNFDLRITPTLGFVDRVVDYEFANGKTYEQSGITSPQGFTRRSVSSVMFDVPIGIKFKSDRKKNVRAYILGGIKYGVNVASKKKSDDALNTAEYKFLKNNKSILSYEAGLGLDIYFEFFKLSPELKVSNSFRNVLKADNTPYANPIEKMYLRNFQFSLFFE